MSITPTPVAWAGSEDFTIGENSYHIVDEATAASLKMQAELVKALQKLTQGLK